MAEAILNIIMPYYAIVGILGILFFDIDRDIFNEKEVLKTKSDFIKCVFMYQLKVWISLNDKINIIGMAILEILTTLSVWFLNIGIFFILLFCLLIKAACYGFWLIFRKRNDDEKNYKKRGAVMDVNILEVADDLHLTIVDNMEKFAEQAIEEYKGKIIKKFEELEDWNNEKFKDSPCKFGEGYGCCIDEVLEIVKSGGIAND